MECRRAARGRSRSRVGPGAAIRSAWSNTSPAEEGDGDAGRIAEERGLNREADSAPKDACSGGPPNSIIRAATGSARGRGGGGPPNSNRRGAGGGRGGGGGGVGVLCFSGFLVGRPPGGPPGAKGGKSLSPSPQTKKPVTQ